MCLAVPAKIVSIEGDTALVDSRGVRFSASLALVEDARVGDYLIIHAGYAISVMAPDDAKSAINIIEASGLGGGLSHGG
ncbi:MAG: HypC/HybG/HupF family hydrogenase formation chaperone [Deltaproteobacteria bacterium]|nr:HypC/HybG/HupF family hydrogenase formation chaperone [Deltaproteobacteria bacterium]